MQLPQQQQIVFVARWNYSLAIREKTPIFEFDEDPISCHDNAPVYPPPPILTKTVYRYIKNPLLLSLTDLEMFLAICELIDKLSRSLSADHDDVDRAIEQIK